MSRAKYKPDCGYGWVVVAACFSMNFIMAGLVRAAGVLYVAIIDVYGVSREVATMPFSIRFCVRNMSGPFVGALGQRFGVRPVVVLGGLVCGLGGILSAFAPNVTWITFAWGGIHGLGYGMCNIIHVITINRYFEKYKGLALGINFTGDCFGTFLLPLLLDFLLDEYNLNGTFLILGGISLHVVPAAMLLMPPPWEQPNAVLHTSSEENRRDTNNKQGIVNDCFDSTFDEDITYRQNIFSRISLPVITVSEQKSNQDLHENHNSPDSGENNRELHSPKQPHMCFIDDFYSNKVLSNHLLNDSLKFNDIHCLRTSTSLRVPEKNLKRKRLSCQINLNRKNSQVSMSSVLSCPSCIGKSIAEKVYNGHFVNPSCENSQTDIERRYLSTKIGHYLNQHGRRDSINIGAFDANPVNINSEDPLRITPFQPVPSYEEVVLDTLDRACEDAYSKKEVVEKQEVQQLNPVLRFIRTNIKPMFLIISATMALFVLLFISVFTIIIDYTTDNGVSNQYGNYLIIAFSVTDIFGRIGFGIVIDRKWLSMSYYAGLTTGIMGLCILIIPLFKSFTFWVISFSVCGFFEGGTAIMFPVLIQHYMDKNEESVALGCLNFYGGLLMLPIPPMIGFFRDVMGSYDGVFWTVGALCVFAGSLWIFEPCIMRKKEKKICQNTKFINEEKL